MKNLNAYWLHTWYMCGGGDDGGIMVIYRYGIYKVVDFSHKRCNYYIIPKTYVYSAYQMSNITQYSYVYKVVNIDLICMNYTYSNLIRYSNYTIV